MTMTVKGKQVQIDEQDAHLLKEHTWHLSGQNPERWYLSTRINGKRVYLHRLIMVLNCPEVDHKDGNRLNNCRSNLRLCSRSQNSTNGRKHRDSKSPYKGVYPDRKKWQARFRKMVLGTFSTPEEAREAYKKAALKYAGEFARFE